MPSNARISPRDPGRGHAPALASARQESLREHNLSVISRLLFSSHSPMSRADLAEWTGMTRSTVSRLVDDLLEGRIVQEGAPVMAGGRGRPAVPLTPAPRSYVGLGLEINVDYLAARVVDLTGETVTERIVPGNYHSADPTETFQEVAHLGRRTVAAAMTRGEGIRMAGSALALPGLVDPAHQRLLLAPNLGWRDVPTIEQLGDLRSLGRRVNVVNEAKAAAVASVAAQPKTKEGESFIYVSGGIGIGAAVVVDGVVEAGVHGWGGEIGHFTVEPDGPKCGCGATGCLEQYAGKVALAEAAGVDVRLGEEALLKACDDSGAQGESARRGVERAAWALGIALAGAVNLLDIHHIVLGGIFTDLAPRLSPVIDRELRKRVLSSEWSPMEVRPASTGQAPAATGAAMQALQTVIADPASWIDDPAGSDGRNPQAL